MHPNHSLALFPGVCRSMWTAILLLLSFPLMAQAPPDGDPPARDTSGFRISELIDTDSFRVDWVSYALPSQRFTLTDTSGYLYYHHYDPARRKAFDDVHLGMPGTASRPVRWAPAYYAGNQPHLDGFQAYRFMQRAPRQYLPETAFSRLSFLRGSDQDDYFFEANAGLRLADSTWFSLDYERLPQIGEYRSQRLRNTGASFMLSSQWWKGRVQTHVLYQAYEMIQENNGGVTTDSLFDVPVFRVRANYPVFLDNSQTTLVDRTFEVVNQLRLLKLWGWQVYAAHSVRWDRSSFKYYDASIPDENTPAFYGAFAALYQKGMRQAWRFERLTNDVHIGSQARQLAWLQQLNWKAGVRYTRSRWRPNEEYQRFNEAFIYGELHFEPVKKLTMRLHYETGLFDAALAQQGQLHARFPLVSSLYLAGGLETTRQKPNLLARSMFVNFSPAYVDRIWEDPRSQKAFVAMGVEKWGTYVEFASHWVDQWLYFDAAGQPAQRAERARMYQWSAVQPLAWRFLHMDQSLVWQAGETAALGAIPLFYKNSLYYEGKLLSKSSLLRVGIDFRYLLPGAGWTYFPLNGQFILLDNASLLPFYEADVFAAMKVKVFKAFFRFENMFNAFTGRTGWVHPRFPMQESGIRLGIQWLFVN
jgi:hypothetical protein